MTTIKTHYSPARTLVKFLSDFLRDGRDQSIATIVQLCYTVFFLHLSVEQHNPGLLKLFQQSGFVEEVQSPAQRLPEPRTFGLRQLEFLCKDPHFFEFVIGCQIRVNDRGDLVDEMLVRLAMSFLPSVSDERIDNRVMMLLFQYFANRSSLAAAERLQIAESLTKVLEESAHDFAQSLERTLRGVKEQFEQLMLDVREMLYASSKASDQRFLSHLMLTNVSKEMQMISTSSSSKTSDLMKRQNLLCFALSPVRRKRTSATRQSTFLPAAADGVTEFACFLHGFVGERKYVMCFLPKRFEVIPVATGPPKLVKHKDVRYLLARTGRFAIEIATLNSKDYFLRFEEKDFTGLLAALQAIRFKRGELIYLGEGHIDVEELQRKWCAREISNFDYLMRLNFFSGRSYRDPGCYPIMPCLLTDFDDYSSLNTSFKRIRITNPSTRVESLRDSFVDSSAIMSDFFFDFSLVPDTGLPKWARSRFEFVYNARKLLESPAVSRNLHDWINRAYGQRLLSSTDAVQLFHKVHPARELFDERSSLDCEMKIGSSIKIARLFCAKRQLIRVGFIREDKFVSFLIMEFGVAQINYRAVTVGSIEFSVDHLTVISHQHLLAFSRPESTVWIVRGDQTVEKFALFSTTTLLTGYGNSILFCPDPCSVAQCSFSKGRRIISTICYSEKEITVLAANRLFQILAVATIDGFVHIHDAANGTLLTKHDTKREVTDVIVTSTWGFVIAFSREEIFLFSVNGEFIKAHLVQIPIVKVFSHTTCSRCDFISFVTATNEIGVFDALFPEAPTVIAKVDSDVVSIVYIAHRRTFLVIGANGTVKLQPHSLDFI
jgi:hypothetical protein